MGKDNRESSVAKYKALTTYGVGVLIVLGLGVIGGILNNGLWYNKQKGMISTMILAMVLVIIIATIVERIQGYKRVETVTDEDLKKYSNNLLIKNILMTLVVLYCIM